MVQTYDYLEARVISLEKTVEEMKQTVENFIQTLPTELENIMTTKLQQFKRTLDEKIGEDHESIVKATIPTEEVPLKVINDTNTNTKEDVLVTSDRISEDENEKSLNREIETGHTNKEKNTERKIENITVIVEELKLNSKAIEDAVEQINSKMDAVEEVKECLYKINDINAKLERQDELLKGLQTDGKDAKTKLEQIEKRFTYFNRQITELPHLENVTSPGQSINMKDADGVIKENESNGHYRNWGPQHDHFQDCFFVSTIEIRTLLQQEDHKFIEVTMSKRIFKDVKVVNKYTRFPNTGVYVDLNNKETQTKLNSAISNSKTNYCSPWSYLTSARYREYYRDFCVCLSSGFLGDYQNTYNCRKHGVYDFKSFEAQFGLEWI